MHGYPDTAARWRVLGLSARGNLYAACGGLLLWLGAAALVGLIGFQLYAWMRSGDWISFPALDLLTLLGMDAATGDWIGVYKFLGGLPAHVVLIAAACAGSFLAGHGRDLKSEAEYLAVSQMKARLGYND